MIRPIASLVAALLVCAAAAAQASSAPDTPRRPHTMRIWDNATAPHSNGLEAGDEADGSVATLALYPADPACDTGLAVVICPGGGYSMLAIDHEGHRAGEWLADNGITAAVLRYRLPAGHPEVPLEDATQALRILMGLEAGATGFTPDRVGIMGFSAGGHLAATVSTKGATRPAFAVLFYPVISGDAAIAHRGSFDNLLGPGRTASQTESHSLDGQVDETTPPTLLLLSDDDRTVPPANSLRYYEALKARGIPASMHIYPSGGHGWGFNDGFRHRAQWQQTLLDWLETLPRTDR